MNLSYVIQRSAKRRRLTITVERDRRIIVHAPVGLTDDKVRHVVESKKQWIHEKLRHPQKYQALPHPPGKELVSGESALYLGRQYRIEAVKSSDAEARFSRLFYVPVGPKKLRVEAVRRWYIGKAWEKIVPRVQFQAKRLGVDLAKIKITDIRYRWGSCTTKNNVNINWRLIKAPMFVIDYVITHELAHLIEPNHTSRFWNIVRSQTATMDKAKAWLKENGQLLEREI